MADLSKRFFQISLPKDHHNLFRLIWYEDNDIDPSVTKIFHFTRRQMLNVLANQFDPLEILVSCLLEVNLFFKGQLLEN